MRWRKRGGVTAGIEIGLFLLALIALATAREAPAPSSSGGNRGGSGPAGIIVLGGDLNWPLFEQKIDPATVPNNRVSRGIQLARQYPDALLLYTGAEIDNPLIPIMRGGIAGRRIVWEDRSTTTAENARYSAALVKPRPTETWLLVTDDWHMVRAQRCFQRAGFAVLPEPVHGKQNTSGNFGSYREIVGRVAYAVLGLCDA